MENDITIRDEEDIEERRESDEGEQFTEAAPKERERDIRDKEESEERGKDKKVGEERIEEEEGSREYEEGEEFKGRVEIMER